MKHRVPHDLDDNLARKACEAALQAYQDRFPEFGPTATWRDDCHADIGFSAKGLSLRGSLDLVPGAVEMDLEVPFVFKFLKKKAIDVIEAEIQAWVAKARKGEL